MGGRAARLAPARAGARGVVRSGAGDPPRPGDQGAPAPAAVGAGVGDGSGGGGGGSGGGRRVVGVCGGGSRSGVPGGGVPPRAAPRSVRGDPLEAELAGASSPSSHFSIGFRVEGLGFRVGGLGSGVWGLGLRVQAWV